MYFYILLKRHKEISKKGSVFLNYKKVILGPRTVYKWNNVFSRKSYQTPTLEFQKKYQPINLYAIRMNLYKKFFNFYDNTLPAIRKIRWRGWWDVSPAYIRISNFFPLSFCTLLVWICTIKINFEKFNFKYGELSRHLGSPSYSNFKFYKIQLCVAFL